MKNTKKPMQAALIAPNKLKDARRMCDTRGQLNYR